MILRIAIEPMLTWCRVLAVNLFQAQILLSSSCTSSGSANLQMPHLLLSPSSYFSCYVSQIPPTSDSECS
jgi:hypothetical protein